MKVSGQAAETTSENRLTKANRAETVNLARAALFSALAIGAGYALLLVPNVELITAVVFVSGVYLGSRWGMIVGVLSEFVFSASNPLGSGLVFPPLLIAQVIGMGLIGFVGGILRKPFQSRDWPLGKVIFLGGIGVVLTFIYDTVTTLSYPLAAGFELKQTMVIYGAGLGFTILHQISNAIVFSTALPRVFMRIEWNLNGKVV